MGANISNYVDWTTSGTKAKVGKDDKVHLAINKTNLAQQWAEVAYKGKEVMIASTIPE